MANPDTTNRPDQPIAPGQDQDDAWRRWRDQWSIRSDTIYLNHGSFGPPPRVVQERQCQWRQRLDDQPMDFFVRHYESAWLEAREQIAAFVGAAPHNLALVENATVAMNTVANSFPLRSEDEVVLTDHEYGAVLRIWGRALESAGAAPPRIAHLPARIESAEQIVDAVMSEVTERTRLLVVSHITSPTAIILPIEQIAAAARRRGIAVCVDGPHAPAQTPLSLDDLACDFYTASLHKWVSAPFGSGFLFVSPRWQDSIRSPVLSWGRLSPAAPTAWSDEFVWQGTRDPSAYLACPAAIELLEEVGLEAFRARTNELARYAREKLVELTGVTPLTPDEHSWYGSMASVPLPPGDAQRLQQALWQNHRIEVPVIEHDHKRSIRVSCHLYNDHHDLDALVRGLHAELRQENR